VDTAEQRAGIVADLFEQSKESLFRYALTLAKTIDRADDLVQEAFLRALRHAGTLERMNRHQRDAWLKRVVRHRFFDEERGRKRDQAAVIERVRRAKQPLYVEHAPALEDIIERVPERYRTVIEMRYRLGLNSREIGLALGIPSGTVRSHLHQGIQWLRDEQKASIR